MVTPAEPRNHREALTAMILELQANRIILDGLTDRYGMFLFTAMDRIGTTSGGDQ
jgi:hypothetical protein